MLALEPGIQINYDYFGVVFSTTWKCIDYVHVHWSFLVEISILQKRWNVHESTTYEKVTEQSGNTTNAILLDVISESLQICDFTFFVWTR